MRRFIILSSVLAMTVATALACGPWIRPSYYMFSAFNRNQMGETYTRGLLEYWGQYCAAQTLTPYDISGLAWVSPQIDDFEKSENELIRSAREKNDEEMMQYLNLLCSYLHVCDDVKGDTWSYPSKADLQTRNTTMNYIYNRSRSYTGTRLKPQYDLLAMRTLMILKDYPNILKWWETRVSKQPQSVFKDMAKGIYAHALLNTGKKREACEIYAELGDMRSIKWVMQDNRNLEGIKAEYKENPNSPTLVYLVQDYVNNAQSTLEGLQGMEASLASGYTYEGFEAEVKEARRAAANLGQFIPFAQQVVKEKKTKVPALWMSAAGHLNALLGNNKEGIDMLDKAMKLKGTQRMLDNARVCRLMATIKDAQPTQQYKEYLLGELKWLEQVEGDEFEEAFHYGNTDNHYSEMLNNLCYDYLGPKFIKEGDPNLGLLLMSWCDYREHNLYDGYDNYAYTYARDNYWAVDSLTSTQMIAYQKYLNGGANGKLEKYLIDNGNLEQYGNDWYFADQIGTKLIREGRFEEAIPWLEKVNIDYYSSLKISAYMARRTYKKPRWFFNQTDVNQDEEPMPVKSNQKLEYCRDMVKAINRVATTTGNERAKARYDLAMMYFQASCKGNCWYLSRYANSIYDEPLEYREEKDLVGESVHQLEQAAAEATSFDLKQQCLYANAYIPWGKPYLTYDYDADYNQIPRYDKSTHDYTSHRALADFYMANRSRCNSYISHCDILTKFLPHN